jgi:ABC-type dipeptide/oligopeptide/nickel transport system permease subunit
MSDKKSSPLVWVGIGCGVLFVGGIAFFAFIFFVVFASMRSSAPYQDSVAYAKVHPRVILALGAPVEPGWFVSGKINSSGQSGSVDIDIPLKGSKQNGSLHVVGTKEGGRWTYTRMIMTPDQGEPISLLDPSPPILPSTAPPND